jgi:hypothetical protein
MPGTTAALSFPGFGAGARDKLGQRRDVHGLRHPHREDGVGHPRNRHQIGGRTGQLLVLIGMNREITARPEQKDVIVVSAEKRLDCDQAIAARPILDDDRLAAPAGRQPLCHEPRPDVRTSSGPEWHDELDRTLRPLRCLRHAHGGKGSCQKNDSRCQTRKD